MATSPELLHRTTIINYNRSSERRIIVLDTVLLRYLFTPSRENLVNATTTYVAVENPAPVSRAWYTWSRTVQLTEYSMTILRQLGYSVSSSMKSNECHTLALTKGATRLIIHHRRSGPQDPTDPFVLVWILPYGGPVPFLPPPSVTLDLRKIRDCQEYVFQGPGSGRHIALRFTLPYIFISFFLDVEVLDEQLALPRADTTTTLCDTNNEARADD